MKTVYRPVSVNNTLALLSDTIGAASVAQWTEDNAGMVNFRVLGLFP